MSLRDKLSDHEKNMIGSYISYYACENTGRTASVDYLLRFWDTEKSSYLAKMFNGELMITKPITFMQGIDETSEEVRRYVAKSPVANKFLYDWRNLFAWRGGVENLSEELKYELYDMPSWTNLATNRWNRDTLVIPVPDGTSVIKVQRGTKITKAMQKIAKAYGLKDEEFEAFRIACSQGLNQKVLKGNLTLSIHPLDYMTMSDNSCDWSSCMSWRESGCYRQGTVEMMNSPCVVVAYLAAEDKKLTWSEYEWNSKKWRELMIVTPDMICNILGYPYRNENLSKAAVNMLKEMAQNAFGWEYTTEEPIIWQQDEPFNNGEIENLTVLTETYNMYNDFKDLDHFGFFCKNHGYSGDKMLIINYSGPSECMACGREDPDIEEEGWLVGCCCEQIDYCDCCGERIYSGDEDCWVDGLHLCWCCAQDRIREDINGEEHFDENVKGITLIGDNNRGRYDRVYIYEADWNWETLGKYFKRLYGVRRNFWDTEKVYVSINDLTEDGIKLYCEVAGRKNEKSLRAMFNESWYRSDDEINIEDAKIFTPEEQLYWWY